MAASYQTTTIQATTSQTTPGQAKTNQTVSDACAVSTTVFENKRSYLQLVRDGVSGDKVKTLLQWLPELKPVLVIALSISAANISRLYKGTLPSHQAEPVLDMLQLICRAENLFGAEMARQWLNSPMPALSGDKPIALFDSFVGRKMVADVLQAIEFGDFS